MIIIWIRLFSIVIRSDSRGTFSQVGEDHILIGPFLYNMNDEY